MTQREFPGFEPVRPSSARDRDLRAQGQAAGYRQAQAPGRQAQQQAGRGRYDQRPQQSRRHGGGHQDDETPSWAEPDSLEEFSERWERRGREARQDEERAGQRKRRRLLIAGGIVAAAAIAVSVDLVSGGPGAANLGFGGFVQNFLPGELQQVPNPCTTVSAATLSQDLPGKPVEAEPPENSGLTTECTWTLDSPATHTYRVLDVQFQAYQPSGLASGNGSATFAADDAFATLEDGYAKPAKQAGLVSSKATDLSGMPGGSSTSAFQATQVFDRGNSITEDMAYNYVRYRNVIIRVLVQGNNQMADGRTYATSMGTLTPIANTVATEMASQIVK